MGEQHGVHALLEAGAVTDEVQPPARAFAVGRTSGSGSQIAWHQIPACELGQHPGSIRSVSQASGANPFTFCASAISIDGRRRRADLDSGALGVEQMEVEMLATEIQNIDAGLVSDSSQ